MGGLLLLLALSAVMAFASFLAGALPLSMTLTQTQLRFISSIGVGILVGTSLIVIIPEGVEAIVDTSLLSSSGRAPDAVQAVHRTRHISSLGISVPIARSVAAPAPVARAAGALSPRAVDAMVRRVEAADALMASRSVSGRADDGANDSQGQKDQKDQKDQKEDKDEKEKTDNQLTKGDHSHDHEGMNLPTFQIGFALVCGFVCMFLIDRLPRHAVDRLQTAPTTRHISLDNLGLSSVNGSGSRRGVLGGSFGGGGGSSDDDDDDGMYGDGASGGGSAAAGGFLGLLTPSARQSRGLATTAGLVIHATADGIAMGASATTEDMKLGLVIFVAIMLHKAPAAFGLTSVLLKHGLSKRAARGHLVLFSLAAPFGALSTYIFIKVVWGSNMEGERGQYWTGLLLLFSAGTFLYVAMQAMQEDGGSHEHHLPLGNGYVDSSAQRKQSRPQVRDTLATIAGMLLPLLTQFGHHH